MSTSDTRAVSTAIETVRRIANGSREFDASEVEPLAERLEMICGMREEDFVLFAQFPRSSQQVAISAHRRVHGHETTIDEAFKAFNEYVRTLRWLQTPEGLRNSRSRQGQLQNIALFAQRWAERITSTDLAADD